MNTDWYHPAPPPIVKRVIKAIIKERFSLIITLVILLGGAIPLIRSIPRTYQAKSKLLIEYPRSTEQLTGLDDTTGVGRLDAVGERVNPIKNQVALIESRPLFEQALARLNLSPQAAPAKDLAVNAISGTDLIEVSYTSPSPEIAAEVVQAVVEVYKQLNLRTNREKGSTARQFLEDRLPDLEQQMQTAQEQLQQFQQDSRFLGTSAELETLTQEVSNLEAQLKQAQRELAFTEAKIERLKDQLPPQLNTAVNAAGLSQDRGFVELNSQLLEAERQLAELQTRFTEQNPAVQAAREKRDRFQALVDEYADRIIDSPVNPNPVDPVRQRLIEQWYELEAERSAQQARLSQLSEQLAQMQARLSRLPADIQQHQQLQLQAQTAQQDYLTFKEKYAVSRIAEQQAISNVRVVDPATVPSSPVAPNRKLLYAVALVASTGVALAVVGLRRFRSNALDGVSDLKDYLPLPILATVPWRGNGQLTGEEKWDDPALTQSYRLLQAHLQMLPQTLQIIAVCSWFPAEGRTSVATNLALLEARLGRRVMVVNADGSSTQQQSWEGTHHLNGKGKPQGLDKLLNLTTLPFSETPPLWQTQKWLALLEQVRSHYDLIIIDCPPTVEGAEAAMLAAMSDGVLWVTRPDCLGRRGAIEAAESLRTWSTRLLGQVVIGEDTQPPSAIAKEAAFKVAKAKPSLSERLLRGKQ